MKIFNNIFSLAGAFFGGSTTPTSYVHIGAGTAAAGTSPLKLTPGTNLTTPEAGAIEFDGTNLSYTNNAGTPVRRVLANAVDVCIGGQILKLIGARFVNGFVPSTQAGGTTDVYTCPAGKRALIYSWGVTNFSAGSVTSTIQCKIGGNYYNVSAGSTFGANSNYSGTGTATHPVIEAGESFSVLTTATGESLFLGILEYDNTSGPRSVLLGNPAVRSGATLAAGDNTFYTVSAGKSTLILAGTASSASHTSTGAVTATMSFINLSGGSRTLSLYTVPSGGTAGLSNKVYSAVSLGQSTGTVSQLGAIPITMGAGDFINLNIDANTATQLYWINVAELGP